MNRNEQIKAAIKKLDEAKAELMLLLNDSDKEEQVKAPALPKQDVIMAAFFNEFRYLERDEIMNGGKKSQRVADARKVLFYMLHSYGFNYPEIKNITGYDPATTHPAVSLAHTVPDFKNIYNRLKNNIDKRL
jgi:hypothetical protein